LYELLEILWYWKSKRTALVSISVWLVFWSWTENDWPWFRIQL